jgi:NAD(P)-dependent dehydrogenase (short-subunit alcohol dehydrogenase family)
MTAPVTVVIGGASGIGEATAQALGTAGHVVVVADLAPPPGGIAVDVSEETQVAALFDQVVAEHGGFTGVVNCAGVSTLAQVVDHDAAEFRRVIDVNLTGAFLVVKHAGQRIADGGAIVSLSSLNARQPGTGMVAYCSAKAGMVMLTEVAALELAARGIRVNAVSPGIIKSPMHPVATHAQLGALHPVGHMGEMSDIVGAVLYLEQASFVTGEILHVDGGQSAGH